MNALKITLPFCVITVLLGIYFTSCKHEPIFQKKTETTLKDTSKTGGNTPEDTTICFERDILPIFQSNCAMAGCHDAITHADNYRLYSYLTITSKGIKPGNASGSKIMEEINKGNMPPDPMPPLTADQKKLLTRWINEGAKNGTNCPSKCDSNSFAFAKNIQPILQNKCVGCHNAGNKGGNIDLSNYAGVKATVTSNRLMGSLNWTSGFSAMPKGGSKLSNCELTQFKKWINAGAQNN